MISQGNTKRKSLIKMSNLALVMLLTIGLLLTSCGRINETNRALENLNLSNQEKGTLAVIKNMPNDETVKKVPNLTTLNYDDSMETLLLVPVLNDSTIEIKQLTWDNVELKESGTSYRIEKTADGYGLYIRAMRPEGAPVMKIIVTNPQGQGEYILSYNGKDGTPEIETIKVLSAQ